MKKSLFVIAALALVFAFASCNKENSYTGKYKGTYTFFKQSGSISNPDSTKSGKTVPILHPTESRIMLYDFLPMEKIADGVFQTTEMQSDIMSQLLQMAGVGQNAAENISNVKIRADFTVANHLTYVMTYEVQILGSVGVEVRILQFDGDRQ
ncbi:MAG: hypothetical protein J5644_06535 [Bacteroidales bacterium]|nr:hypothetical protein [Bacteroidales bacterium]